MTPTWKRRDFLRHAAMSTLVAPVAAYWTDLPEVRAQPRKTHMILAFWPNGKCPNNKITIRNPDGSWSFAPGFKAYEKYKSDAIAFHEYDFEGFTAQHYASLSTGHGHNDAAACLFTGDILRYSTARCQSPSIDQIVAWEYLRRGIIKDPSRKTLPIAMDRTNPQGWIYYQTPDDYTLGKSYSTQVASPVPVLLDPAQGFQRMFEGVSLAGGNPIVDKLWRLGRGILDGAHADIRALQPGLPAEGRALLEAHLQRIRELEQALASAPSAASCQKPALEPIARTADNHRKIWSQWVRIAEVALRCDATRIVTIQLGGAGGNIRLPWLGLSPVGSGDISGDGFHAYTHWKQGQVPLFLDFFSQCLVELMDALKGDGTPVRPDILKDSVVMVGCESGRDHLSSDVPVMLFGQCGGYFKTGQLLTYGTGANNNVGDPRQNKDLSSFHKHTGTLLAVCHAMGLTELKAVGNGSNPLYQKGPVPELRA